jgi:hypothetical protein
MTIFVTSSVIAMEEMVVDQEILQVGALVLKIAYLDNRQA